MDRYDVIIKEYLQERRRKWRWEIVTYSWKFWDKPRKYEVMIKIPCRDLERFLMLDTWLPEWYGEETQITHRAFSPKPSDVWEKCSSSSLWIEDEEGTFFWHVDKTSTRRPERWFLKKNVPTNTVILPDSKRLVTRQQLA